MTDRRPLVAISEGFADYGDYYGFGYGRPLLAAGALPVLLPYYEQEEDRVDLIERVDGLVLAGGQDIEAWRYGREGAASEAPARAAIPRRDRLSYALLAVEEAVPVLGVCRGCQVLNVALGGTLYGDLDEFPAEGADHPGAKWDEWRALVAATLEGAERPPHPTHPVDGEAGFAPGVAPRGELRGRQLPPPGREGSRDGPRSGRLGARTERSRPSRCRIRRRSSSGVQWELHEEWQDDQRMLGIWETFVADARRADGGARSGRGALTASRSRP